MTKLKIQRDDLIQALTIRCELMEGGWYLDIETGEVLLDSDAVDGMPDDLQENPRYRWIEPISSDESFRIMEQFVASLSDAKAAARLSRALDGPKPFRRFKDALLDFPARRKAYFKFQQAEHIRIAEAWCEENDIEVEWVEVPRGVI